MLAFSERLRHLLFLVVIILSCIQNAVCQSDDQTCNADGVCTDEASSTVSPKCGLSKILCEVSKRKSHSLYRRGSGTAMAYKPEQPFKQSICEGSVSKLYRPASWLFSRSSSKEIVKVTLEINLWTCQKESSDTCCCHSFRSAEHQQATIDAWQTKPDGTYSSLRPGVEEGICRSRQTSNGNSIVFETLAPGSTGVLNGLGPNGWDFWPYGPPVIHMLISAPGYQDLLLDLPMLIDFKKTLDSKSFWGPDFRGPAWVGNSGPKKQQDFYQINSWGKRPGSNSVQAVVDVFLQPSEDYGMEIGLCQSTLYGLPSSFFLEPITLCAPSILDFLSL